MITLKRLKWNNCFSYGDNNELDLDSSNVTQIIGKNGMGKSSIPLIIEEVLYNKNSKGIKKADIPNRYINDGYDIKRSAHAVVAHRRQSDGSKAATIFILFACICKTKL